MRGKPLKEAVRIAALQPHEIDELCALAAEIWRAHYPAIISAAQIEYMLAQRYAPAVLRAELAAGGVWWDILRVNGRMAGFSSYFFSHAGCELKLDKLYVHPLDQRRGYGGMLIDRAVTIARAYGRDVVTLAVNKRNSHAITAYCKYGFEIGASAVKDIGGGFVMDDFVMSRHV
jgi:GNAT superfamily N-acetyltransferase